MNALVRLLTLTATCAGPALTFAQPNAIPRESHEGVTHDSVAAWGELRIMGRPNVVALTGSGRVWLGTMTGNLYSADSVAGSWHDAHATNPVFSSDTNWFRRGMFGVGLVYGMQFFDAAHGMAWGGLQRGNQLENHAQVYITEDSGRQWRAIDVGRAFILGPAQLTPDGEAWITGYVGGLLTSPLELVLFHSSDYGRSWQALEAPVAQHPAAAIAFDGPARGLIGTIDNRLLLTTDTGKQWQAIPTPFDQHAYDADSSTRPTRPITGAWFIDGRLLALEDAQLFQSDSSPIRWHRTRLGLTAGVTRDPSTGEFCAVDERDRPVRLGPDLIPHVLADSSLIAPPVAIACSAGRMLVLDTDYRLSEIDHGELVHAFPLTADVPIRGVRHWQLKENVLWGATDHFLYTSLDTDRTWRRVPYAESSVRDFVPRSADVALVWDGHGATALVNRQHGTMGTPRGLDSADVVGVVRSDSVWIAYGGQQYETTRRIDVARTFFAGEFRGSLPYGFVVVSRDEGATWGEIMRWTEGGVAALCLAPDMTRMLLTSYLGSVRVLLRTGNVYTPQTLVLASEGNRAAVPYVQSPTVLYCPDDSTAFVSGSIELRGVRSFRTTDGGAHWMAIDSTVFPYSRLALIGDRVIAVHGLRVDALEGARRERVADLPSLGDARWEAIEDLTPVNRSDTALVTISDPRAGVLHVLLDTRRGTWVMIGRPND